jgi:hypothetical protein
MLAVVASPVVWLRPLLLAALCLGGRAPGLASVLSGHDDWLVRQSGWNVASADGDTPPVAGVPSTVLRLVLRGCLGFGLVALAASLLVLVLGWTPAIDRVPEYVVLVPSALGFPAALAASAATRKHTFRFGHLPWWAKAIWLALAITVAVLWLTGERTYEFGSRGRHLAAFVPRAAFFGIWCSYAAIMWTWAALRFPINTDSLTPPPPAPSQSAPHAERQ